MAAECLAAIHCCRIRVTRLDALGNPTAGPNNVYVSDNPLVLGVTPEVQTGDDKTLIGGCDCVAASYKGTDKLKRFNLELDLAKIEPPLLEMLLGATLISSGGDPIGVWWPNQLACSADQAPNVAFEAWQTAWEDDHPAPTLPYWHWLWTSSYWQLGAQSIQNEFYQPKLVGFTRANSNWGEGIFGDQPEAVQDDLGGLFRSETIPTADCDYASQAIT